MSWLKETPEVRRSRSVGAAMVFVILLPCELVINRFDFGYSLAWAVILTAFSRFVTVPILDRLTSKNR